MLEYKKERNEVDSMKPNVYSKLLNAIVIAGIVVTFMLLLGTPLIVTAFLKVMLVPRETVSIVAVTACIYICALPYVIALFKLKKLCSLIVKNNPFSHDSVKSLKVIAACAFVEVAAFVCCIKYLKHTVAFFKHFAYGGPMIVIAFFSVLIGFICLVLSQLFDSAIKIKEENDFTI